jgi:F0F1-type ATP synthase membrane subunit a
MVNIYLNIFLYDIFLYVLLIISYIAPAYVLSLETFEDQTSFAPNYYNIKVQNISEGIDELMDSWSDSAGADETNDSSSTLVFGSCFLIVNVQGMLTYIPLCINPASDINIMLIFCEDCILGTLISLIPILGFRTYAETVNKDIPFVFIPVFIIIEIAGQTMRVLSIALRMAINVTAGHNLFFIVLNYIYAFIVCTVKLKYQFCGLILITFTIGLLSIDSVISSVQSYVIIMLETYYELDSE